MRPSWRRKSFPVLLVTGLLVASVFNAVALAQSRTSSAVDVVSLKSGRTLRGAILSRQADGTISVAVSRAWLNKSDPHGFETLAHHDAEQQRAAWLQTKERIEAQLANPPSAAGMVFFLKQEQQRLDKLLAQETPPEQPFIVIDVPAGQVGKAQPATPDRQRMAIFAWSEGLNGVETRSAEALQKDLVKKGIDVNGPVPDLSDQLPARPQSDDEWSARSAIVEYTLEGALDFQGMGETLVRTGTGKPINLSAILPKILSKQVDSLIGDLLQPDRNLKPAAETFDQSSLRPAITEAEKEQRNGFRVTRLDMNPERLSVAVDTRFVAKLPNGEWQTIWSHTESADGSQSRPKLEAQIAEDPQVKSALEAIKGLGLGADDAVTQAIRVGAATMAAQSAADARFFEFRDRYARRLDGPVLAIPIMKP